MSAPAPPSAPSVPPTLSSAAQQSQQLLLASFPLIALGVVGIAFAAFLLSTGRINRAHLYLWISLGAAFLGGLFQAANVLQCAGVFARECVAEGLVVVEGLALACFVTFKLFFLFRRVRQLGLYDPSCPRFPLPLATQATRMPSPQPTSVARESGWQNARKSGPGKRVYEWTVRLAILSTGIIDAAWRIGVARDISDFVQVYAAANALQLILPAGFLLHALVVLHYSAARPRLHDMCSYIPVLAGIFLGIGISIAALASFPFTETPLGRFLTFLQLYIFLLETSILDHKRPYRDSLSFERTSRRSPSSSHQPKPDEAAPALSRSPLDRASQPLTFPSLGPRDGWSDSELGSSGMGPVLRRRSNLPSWLPFRRSPEAERYGSSGQEEGRGNAQERLSLTADAALPGTAQSTLFVEHLPPSAAPKREQMQFEADRSRRSVEATSGNAGGELWRAAEEGRVNELVALPAAAPGSSPPPAFSSTASSRRQRPTLTIDTSLSAPASASKPLPALPAPTPVPADAAVDSTSTEQTFVSFSASALPSGLRKPTQSSEPPAPRPSLPPPASPPPVPPPAQLGNTTVSSAASSARSSILSLSLVDGVLKATRIETFPYPPAAALIRTSSRRTEPVTSLGRSWDGATTRVRSRGSEFDLVPPRRLFVPGEAEAGMAGDEGDATLRAGGSGSAEGAGGGGMDVTSLIAGSDYGETTREELAAHSPSPSRPSSPAPSNCGERDSPVAGTARPSTPWPGNGSVPLAVPLGGGLATILAPHRPVHLRAGPPTSKPPLHAAPLPLPAPAPSASYPPPPRPAAAETTHVRRPSAVALAAAQIRAERLQSGGEPTLSRPTGVFSPTAASPVSRLKGFIFPSSGGEREDVGRGAEGRRPSDAASSEGSAEGRGRILLNPETPFERPRRVPSFPRSRVDEGEGGKGESPVSLHGSAM